MCSTGSSLRVGGRCVKRGVGNGGGGQGAERLDPPLPAPPHPATSQLSPCPSGPLRASCPDQAAPPRTLALPRPAQPSVALWLPQCAGAGLALCQLCQVCKLPARGWVMAGRCAGCAAVSRPDPWAAALWLSPRPKPPNTVGRAVRCGRQWDGGAGGAAGGRAQETHRGASSMSTILAGCWWAEEGGGVVRAGGCPCRLCRHEA